MTERGEGKERKGEIIGVGERERGIEGIERKSDRKRGKERRGE